MAQTVTTSLAPSKAASFVLNAPLAAFRAFADWYNAQATRREMMKLTDAQLKDVGLSRADF